GNLTNISELYLQFNALTGSIPAEIGNLSVLKQLALHDNLLTGPIPPELGSAGVLEELYLFNNDLTGPIPPELGALDSLLKLYLYANHLDGTIPPTIGGMTSLQELEIDRNKFSGDVPIDITFLPLTDLDVGYNMLTATNPTVIAFLDSLDVLWRETQTISPDDMTSSFDPATGTLNLSWTPILFTAFGGYYTVGCSLTPGGDPPDYATDTFDKKTTEVSFVGLPVDDYFCSIQTFTPANVNNDNDLTSPISLPITAIVTTQPAPPNDGATNPALIDNDPYQVFIANFGQASADGSNTPSVPDTCTTANLNAAKSLYFTIAANPPDRQRDTRAGGPGFFPGGYGVMEAGGPGHFGHGTIRAEDPTDTVIAIYRKEANQSLTLIACNDDIDGSTPASQAYFNRDTAATYVVVVWTKDASTEVVFQTTIVQKIYNGSFEVDIDGDKQPDGWKTGNDEYIRVKCKPGKPYSEPCMLQIKGTGVSAKLKQKLDYVGDLKAGETVSLAGYISRKNIVPGGSFMLKVVYVDSSQGDNGKAKVTLTIPEGTSTDYELAQTPMIELEGTVASALVRIRYKGASGKLWLDDVQFTREDLAATTSAKLPKTIPLPGQADPSGNNTLPLPTLR
ncbi:MAG TPA: hypothetical protein VHL11_21380, partial [Phototrophicaceae bacterium]|nr:hypothetical protein [Phototrophicaceae bacterium]